MKQSSLKIFISYSHRDVKLKESLLVAMASLNQKYNIDVWHDGKILAGDNIDKEVLDNLSSSDVVLLLITPDFLNSMYCMQVELKKAITRMKKSECIVIPVIGKSSTLLDTMPFYKLKRVPTDGKPICDFRPHQKGCVEATEIIKSMIDDTFPDCVKKAQKKTVSNKINKGETTTPCVRLYKNGNLKDIAINQNFINLIPDCTKNIVDFNQMMEQALDNYVKRFRKKYKTITSNDKIQTMEMEELRLFLMDICSYIKKYITDSVGIRVHFRGTKGKNYVGILASTEKDDTDDLATDWSTDLTPIPVMSGLIYYSTELKAPLLKSLNPKLNFKGNNDNIWKEYLTYSFRNLDKGKKSVLSMAISVHKDYLADRKELFMLLAYINIGEMIEDYIKRYRDKCLLIDNSYNIEKIISKFN